MRSVHVTVRVGDSDAPTVFQRVGDFSRYPEFSEVVRAVDVTSVTDHSETSDWEVYFRNGILRWTERDRFDPDAGTIAFEQEDGDFAEFHGEWHITEDGADCLVHFTASFDFGIPSLAGILDPVAERVFRETIARVVLSLFDTAGVVGDPALQEALNGTARSPHGQPTEPAPAVG